MIEDASNEFFRSGFDNPKVFRLVSDIGCGVWVFDPFLTTSVNTVGKVTQVCSALSRTANGG
jgi:hypothetical protein